MMQRQGFDQESDAVVALNVDESSAILPDVYILVADQTALLPDTTPPGIYRPRGRSSLQRLFRLHRSITRSMAGESHITLARPCSSNCSRFTVNSWLPEAVAEIKAQRRFGDRSGLLLAWAKNLEVSFSAPLARSRELVRREGSCCPRVFRYPEGA